LTAKYRINWGIWIGVMTGIYVFLYLNSPLAQYGIIWITFIALPIFFNGGAARQDYFSYFLSNIAGVAWGLIFLFFIAVFANFMSDVLATALGCLIFTALCCLHMLVPNKFLFNKVPAMFGGISATFSQGGENVLPVILTLLCGVTLALICNEGRNFLSESGSWTFKKSKS